MQSPSDKQHHKKRVSKACDCCRKSKTKCDGMRPCTRCLQDNKICTYMTNKKKADKTYSSSYVDLLETRVSILLQSMTHVLEKAKDSKKIKQFISDPVLYNEDGEIDINKVICQLLSSEKLQNLSQSNEDYSIDEITNVTGGSQNKSQPLSTSTSSASNDLSSANTPPTPKMSIPRRYHSQSESHIHKPQHHHHHPKSQHSTTSINNSNTNRSPSSLSSSFDFPQNNLDSLLYADTTSLDLTNNDDAHSTNSSLMSPVYSINENLDASATSFDNGFTLSSNATSGNNLNIVNSTPFDGNYEFNWDQFDQTKIKDEFQLVPQLENYNCYN